MNMWNKKRLYPNDWYTNNCSIREQYKKQRDTPHVKQVICQARLDAFTLSHNFTRQQEQQNYVKDPLSRHNCRSHTGAAECGIPAMLYVRARCWQQISGKVGKASRATGVTPQLSHGLPWTPRTLLSRKQAAHARSPVLLQVFHSFTRWFAVGLLVRYMYI